LITDPRGDTANGFLVKSLGSDGRWLVATSRQAHLPKSGLSVRTHDDTKTYPATPVSCSTSGAVTFMTVTLPMELPVLHVYKTAAPSGYTGLRLGYWRLPPPRGIAPVPYESEVVIGQDVPGSDQLLHELGVQSAVRFSQISPNPAGSWVIDGQPIVDGHGDVLEMVVTGQIAITDLEIRQELGAVQRCV
jgi:hypothetical protein